MPEVSSAYARTSLEIDEYVKKTIQTHKYTPYRVRDDKVIRCSVFGFNVFFRHEINLIDSPFLQRLRGIYQTSLALFTYPGATHSRFEHSLGCATNAERMLKSLRERGQDINKNHSAEVRLAALLHDVGHGPFSHGSEKIYGHFDELSSFFTALVGEKPELFEGCQAHEMLSYFIIVSPSFKKMFQDITALYNSNETFCDLGTINLDRVGLMILGKIPDGNKALKFLTQIINGPFDVDKIDYLHRDGHHTGLNTGIDVERLFLTLETVTNDQGEHVLSVDLSGATVLEQLLFNKSILFASVYHHHKVRSALYSLVKLFHYIQKHGWTLGNYNLSTPVGFLCIDECDILNSIHIDINMVNIISNIRNRKFLKRALVIAPISLADEKSGATIAEYENNLEGIKELELEIIDGLTNSAMMKGNVFFDFPERPRFRGTARESLVRISKNHCVPLEDVHPVRGWVTGYSQYRFKAYIFCPAGTEEEVGVVAYRVLESKGVSLKPTAFELAKHDMSYIRGILSAGPRQE